MLLKKGSKGSEVKELQKALGVAADGIFGTGTEAVVKKFQKDNGLDADGMVGNKTWEAIGIDTDSSSASEERRASKSASVALPFCDSKSTFSSSKMFLLVILCTPFLYFKLALITNNTYNNYIISIS